MFHSNLDIVCMAAAQACTSVWNTGTSTHNNMWNSVCYADLWHYWVAVSDSNMMVSTTGLSWSPVTPPAANSWKSVCWARDIGVMCAVGSTGGTQHAAICTSRSISFTLQTTPDRTWCSVCRSPELELFVAVADDAIDANSVMTSPDGVTWTSRTAAATAAWKSVCWSPELGMFVAVSSSATAMYSYDGITWSAITFPYGGWTSVCWSAELGLFCAVGTQSYRILVSRDGFNWTTITSMNIDASFASVASAEGLGTFCAVADGGSAAHIAVSHDGYTWNTRTITNPTDLFRGVAWSVPLARFCIVGQSAALNTSNVRVSLV